MSLKARIEAVIYAAEEPVTLTQLAALFADEITAPPQSQPVSTTDSDSAGEGGIAPAVAAAERGDDATPSPEAVNATATDAAIVQTPAMDAEEPGSAPGESPGAASEASPDAKTGVPEADDAARAEAAARKAEQKRLRDAIKAVVDELIADYAGDGEHARGMEIREVAGGYRMATRPEYHDAVRGFIKSLKPPLKLSLPALETLAVIAYKQPVTAPEIGEIRGVDSGGVLGSLLTRKLITTAGRKQVVGRPILYKTTREFLLRFGLKDVNELPSLEEFEKMAAEITDLDESSGTTQQDTLAFARAEHDEAADAEDGAAPATASASASGLVEQPEPDASPEPREPALSVDTDTGVPEADSLIYAVEDEQGRP